MDPSQLQPGYRLDRYELLCPLAYGGMASVWLARFGGRKGFERLVVVKMILPQFSQDPRFQEMFLDEARIASRIEHANVARILDVGEQDENTFIVMEWVDGDSLSKVLRAAEQRKQPVPAGIALRICADAAAGLHAAHSLRDRETGAHLGVVHRDVSPQNILISNAGSTVLIDFGVAKARDRVSQDTSAGQLKGKIRYMAPEQALGRPIDHRADVWALGAILYELFAGDSPYEGPNEVATLHKLTSGAAPPPLPAHVPAPARAVIERALAHDPDERYGTALELNFALETAMVEIGEPASIAVVAHYTEQLLNDRKAARKRAVDGALATARAREASAPSGPLSSPPSHSSRPSRPSAGTPVPPATPSSYSSSYRSTPAPLSSEAPSFPTGLGLSEIPSATSSATLGSTAMEYPPRPLPEADDADGLGSRRYVTAAILGVAVAAGLVVAVLIIASAVMSPPGGTTSTSAANAPQEAPAAPTAADHAPPPPAETAEPPQAAPGAGPDPRPAGNEAPTGTTATPGNGNGNGVGVGVGVANDAPAPEAHGRPAAAAPGPSPGSPSSPSSPSSTHKASPSTAERPRPPVARPVAAPPPPPPAPANSSAVPGLKDRGF